jgi:hypothetical protein
LNTSIWPQTRPETSDARSLLDCHISTRSLGRLQLIIGNVKNITIFHFQAVFYRRTPVKAAALAAQLLFTFRITRHARGHARVAHESARLA